MPLMHSKSKKAFEHNLKQEMHEGKPMKQSLAIAYSLKRRGKKMAKGGSVEEGPSEKENQMGVHKIVPNYEPGHGVKHGQSEARYGDKKAEHHKVINELRSMPSPKLKGLAYGGEVDPYHHSLSDPEFCYEEEKSGYEPHEGNDVKPNHAAMAEDASMEHEDMVGKIMKKRMLAHGGMYSEGGVVANECHDYPDEHPNEFDDLVLDDHLEPHFPADGNEHGDPAQHERNEDMVSKIMKSRAKKDRLPRI